MRTGLRGSTVDSPSATTNIAKIAELVSTFGYVICSILHVVGVDPPGVSDPRHFGTFFAIDPGTSDTLDSLAVAALLDGSQSRWCGGGRSRCWTFVLARHLCVVRRRMS